MIRRARWRRIRLMGTVLTTLGHVLLPELHASCRRVIASASDNEQRNVSYDIDTWIPHQSYTVEHP